MNIEEHIKNIRNNGISVISNLISKKDLPLKCKKPIVDFKDIYPYTEGSFN